MKCAYDISYIIVQTEGLSQPTTVVQTPSKLPNFTILNGLHLSTSREIAGLGLHHRIMVPPAPPPHQSFLDDITLVYHTNAKRNF